MPRKLRSFAVALLSALAFLTFVPRLPAQPPGPSLRATTDLYDLLRRGHVLEVERRWGEAVVHYEDGLRQFPGEDALKQRFDFARLHYDVSRRYADRSFREGLSHLSYSAALDLYSEVLLKIHAHYVETPHWKELVACGTNGLAVALTETAFLETNLRDPEVQALDAFRDELGRLLAERPVASRDEARDAVISAVSLARQQLGVPPTAVVMEYLCGAAGSLDPYSTYLTPDQLSEVYSQIKGNFVGLGVELRAQEGALVIVRVIPNSPAQRSGLCEGDRIVAVNGHQTRNLSTDHAANLLQGEADSIVELTAERPGSEPRTLRVRRQRVEVPSVDDTRLLDPSQGIAYLKLSCFQEATYREVDDALWRLHRLGMKKLILDLRGNPGGLLVSAVEVADLFLERGVIVATRGRNAYEDFTYSAREAGTWRVPLVVLIDGESASAAEIFAGAIRDHHRGTIVGQRSFGKGSVQGIFPLNVGSAGLRLTTAKFYSPSGRPYSIVGVEPHVAVRQAARPVTGASGPEPPAKDNDPMLAAALQVAIHLLAQR